MTLAILLALLRTAGAFAADSDGDGYIDAVEAGRSVEAADEALGPDERRLEGLQLALRLREGVPAEALPLEDLPGLVTVDGERAVLTRRGRLLANEVALRLR